MTDTDKIECILKEYTTFGYLPECVDEILALIHEREEQIFTKLENFAYDFDTIHIVNRSLVEQLKKEMGYE